LRGVSRKLQFCRRVSSENDASDWFHQIKRRAQDRFVVTVTEDLRSGGIDAVEPRENTELSSHVMRGLHLAAERRATKNEFLAAQRNGVRQVRMAARILPARERPVLAWKVSAEKRLQFGQVQLFAGAHRSRAIPKIGHLLYSAAEKIGHFRLLCAAQR